MMSDASFSDEYPADSFVTTLTASDQINGISINHLPEFTFHAISVYGLTNNSELIKPLMRLYPRFRQECQLSTREALYEQILEGVAARTLSVNALLPFLLEENSRELVSRSALDYLHLRPVEAGDELAGATEILRFVEHDHAQNGGALLGGLVLTGEKAVHDLVLNAYPIFNKKRWIDELARVTSGFTYSDTFELYLTWLEKLNADREDELFGSLAAGLVNTVRAHRTGEVITVKRTLGCSDDNSLEIIERVPIHRHFEQILPRLNSLRVNENPPGIMDQVIYLWRKALFARLPFRAVDD